MVDAGTQVAHDRLAGEQSFAVRATRRGAQAYSSVDVRESVLEQCILGGRPMHSGAYHLLLVRPDLVRIVAEQLASVDETRFLAVWKGEPETGRGLGREVTALYRQAAERGDAVVFAAKA